jgi:trimeric autotransporter adhesin
MKMKSILIFTVVLLLLTQHLYSQNVGINSTGAVPNSSAMLDIVSNNMGLLVPRVALVATNNAAPVTVPAISLLVYNTATAGVAPNNVTPGYYFWDGAKWVRFQDGNSGDDWHIDGNTGTNSTTDFIGTLDNQNFITRTNGIERMRVEAGGDVGVGTTNPAAKFHSHQSGTAPGDIAILATQNITLTTGITAALFVAGNTDYDIYQYSGGRNALWAPTAIGHNAPTQMLDVNGNLRLRSHIFDSNNSAGNNGDILSRDAGGVVWVSPSCESFDESFESDFGIWSNLTNDDADWTRHTGTTTSASTGPTSANDGSYYIYCETSSPRVAGDLFMLQTNVRTCDNPSISFDYHMYFNTTTDGTLTLEVSDDNGATWTSLWSLTGNQGNVWTNDQTVSLAAYANSFISLRYSFTIGSLGTSYQYDCALDDILLSDISGVYPISSGSSSGDDWALLGNAGTNPATNFIGTTDNQEFSIRTNNTEKIRLTTKGQIEPVNTGNSVFIGNQAGENDDLSGNENVFVGYFCGRSNTTGTSNIAIGDNALTDNVSGNYNTAFGVNALGDNTTGINNIAIGNGASFNNLTGNYNIAHGAGALSFNTAGNYNVALGYGSQNRNQSSGNVSLGLDALRNATTGCDYNVAIGYYSMRRGTDYTNTAYNVSIGFESMYNALGGDNNVSIGRVSMRSTTTGYDNVSIGYETMYFNTSGYENVGIGERSLYRNTTGNGNVAIGYWACQGDANGVNNTGVGKYALYQNQGNYNSGFGYAAGAGAGSPTYTYCSFLGYDSDATGSYTNAMALGYSASVTNTNYVRVGNTSVTRIGGQVGWTTISDGRVKENIKENVVGLDFIMNLRPITYNINKDKQDQIIGRIDSSEYDEKYDIEKLKFTGFIAQEVDKAALDVGFDFSGVKKPAHDNDLYGLNYSEFVVPLVKATQEQQVIIEQQQQIIQDLQKQNLEILQRLEEMEKNK